MILFTAPVYAADSLTHAISTPASWRAAVDVLIEREAARQKTKHPALTVRLSVPHRPRTTGWKSQNHHLRGHARQLCEDTGFTMQEMMQVIKADTPSWPVEYKEFNGKTRMIYASEADVSIEVCSEAIEITHRIAADRGINLIEGD